MTEINPVSNKKISEGYNIQNKQDTVKEIVIPLVSDSTEVPNDKANDKNILNWLSERINKTLEKLDEDKKFQKTKELIENFNVKYNLTMSKEDIDYWTKLINDNAESTNTSPAIIAAVIARETSFKKNTISINGAGSMQITTITVNDMFSNENGGRQRLYKMIDENTLNEILYQTDKEGNPLTDKNGNYIRKYSSPHEIRNTCGKDENLGIKVGIMCLKMKFAESVSRKYGISLTSAIEQLKSGELKLSEKELEEITTNALKNYNSVFIEYAPAVIDSLKTTVNDTDSLTIYKVPKKNNQ